MVNLLMTDFSTAYNNAIYDGDTSTFVNRNVGYMSDLWSTLMVQNTHNQGNQLKRY
jgi:hypothetical protein